MSGGGSVLRGRHTAGTQAHNTGGSQIVRQLLLMRGTVGEEGGGRREKGKRRSGGNRMRKHQVGHEWK